LPPRNAVLYKTLLYASFLPATYLQTSAMPGQQAGPSGRFKNSSNAACPLVTLPLVIAPFVHAPHRRQARSILVWDAWPAYPSPSAAAFPPPPAVGRRALRLPPHHPYSTRTFLHCMPPYQHKKLRAFRHNYPRKKVWFATRAFRALPGDTPHRPPLRALRWPALLQTLPLPAFTTLPRMVGLAPLLYRVGASCFAILRGFSYRTHALRKRVYAVAWCHRLDCRCVHRRAAWHA